MTEGYESYTATPASESELKSDKKGGNQQFPDVLSEQPTAAERKTWVETAVRNMSETQRSVYRGATPTCLLDRDVEPTDALFPEIALAADKSNQSAVDRREDKRADSKLRNLKNAKYTEEKLHDIRDDIAQQVAMAMERHARFTLDKLKELFVVTGKPDLHDGPAMIKRFLSDGSTAASTNISTEKAEENFKAMMAKPLPDGVDPSTFATRCNIFQRDINPYLEEPKGNKAICSWMWKQLPASCFTLRYNKEQEAKKDGWDTDKTRVQTAAMEILSAIRNEMIKNGGAGVGLMSFVPVGAGTTQPGAAAFAGWASQPAGVGVGGGGLKKLPQGQRCPQGTCTFDHKGFCFRSCKCERMTSVSIWKDKKEMDAIEQARQADAKKLGVPYVKLKPPRSIEKNADKTKKWQARRAAKAAAAAATAGGAAVPTESTLFQVPIALFSTEDDDEAQMPDLTEEVSDDEDEAEQSVSAAAHAAAQKIAMSTASPAETKPTPKEIEVNNVATSNEARMEKEIEALKRKMEKSEAAETKALPPAANVYVLMALALCAGVVISTLVAALIMGGVGSAGAATTSTALVAVTPRVAIKSACTALRVAGGAAYAKVEPYSVSAMGFTALAAIQQVLVNYTWLAGLAVRLGGGLMRWMAKLLTRRPVRDAAMVMAGAGTVTIVLIMLGWLAPGVGGVPSHSAVKTVSHGLRMIEPVPGYTERALQTRFDTIYLDINDGKAMAREPNSMMTANGAAELAAVAMNFNNAAEPAMANHPDFADPAMYASRSPRQMVIADTGAGRPLVPDKRYAIEGSIGENKTKVSTANGITIPKFHCDIRLPTMATLADKSLKPTSIKMEKAIIHPACEHILVPIGAMAKTHNLGLVVQAGTGNAKLLIENEQIGPPGSVIELVNHGILLFPDGALPKGGAHAVVTHGSRGSTSKVTYETLHSRIMHRQDPNIGYLHRCTSDAPPSWAKLVPGRNAKCACDACLRGVAKAHPAPAGSHVPKVTKPGQLVSMDCWKCEVPYRWGGQQIVFLIHDHFSGRDFSFLCHSESECAGHFRSFLAQCKHDKVEVCRVNADNAKVFASDGTTTPTVKSVCSDNGIKFTTSCEYTPRQNGKCEHRFSIKRSDICKQMACAGAKSDLWWDCFRHSCDVDAMLPIDGAPDECGYSRWTGGIKPAFASTVRAWGCVCYAKFPVANGRRVDGKSKVEPQAARCMHLGRCPDQPGWKCLELSTGRIFNTPHVDFVETCFPGMTLDKSGNEQLVPPFSNEYDPSATPVSGRVDKILDKAAAQQRAAGRGEAPAPQPQAPQQQVPPQAQRVPRPAAPTGPNDPMSQRLSRANRTPTKSYAECSSTAELADTVMTATARSDGSSYAGTVSVPAGPFVVYLCSGVARAGDFAEHLSKYGIGCITVDTVNACSLDLTNESVTLQLEAAAAAPNCIGVLASFPCSTWSAARYEPGGPPVVRDVDSPAGIMDEHGRVPSEVLRANKLMDNGVRVLRKCKGACVVESPVWRGEGSPNALVGRERHTSMFSYPPLLRWAAEGGCKAAIFDQCMTGLEAMKSTQLLGTPNVQTQLADEFGNLKCNHTSHGSFLGKTSGLQQYTSDMCGRLASVFANQGGGARKAEAAQDESPVQVPGGGDGDYADDAVQAVRRSPRLKALAPELDKAAVAITRETTGLSVLDAWDWAVGGQCPAVVPATDARVGTLEPPPRGGDGIFFFSAVEDEFDGCEYNTAYALAVEDSTRTYLDAVVPALAVKTKGGDYPTFKECMRNDTKMCEDACDTEMATLRSFNAYEEVPEDMLNSWNPNWRRSWDSKSGELGQASEVTDTLWAMRYKRDHVGKVEKLKARCSFDGAQRQRKMQAAAARGGGGGSGGTKLETFSPTTRSTTFCLASATAKARKMKHKSFDVSGAYLQGAPRESEIVYARPPPGYRTFNEHGVPIVWRMLVPLYGQEDAGLIWYRTFVEQLVAEQKFKQSEADPCFFYKEYEGGARCEIVLYVDDGFVFASEGCAEIEAELDALAKRFKIKIVDPKQFLGLNVDAKTEDSEMKVSMRAYIDKIVGDCLTKPLAEWTPLTTPCKPKLLEAYEAAKEKAAAGERPSEALQKRYRTKLGKLMFASSSGVRADLAYGVGICARCASYPTSEMEAHLEHQAAYAGQTSSDGVVFAQDDAAELIGYSDSDWHVAHSTSAHCIMFGKACVGYGSRRQHCISMSSTEAEVIAASQAALEMVYMRKLLREMGYELDKPTVLYVDNTGAVELSKHRKSCNRSRHVLRRYLKVRELVAQGDVEVKWVDTKENIADLLSKGTIDAAQFDYLKGNIMNGVSK